MATILEDLKAAYSAYIDEHDIRPDYLLMCKSLYTQLQYELSNTEQQYRPYIDDVYILELNNSNGFLYVKK